MGGRFQWFRRRRMTFGLAVFLSLWYLVQLLVVAVTDFRTAVWWFYLEPPLGNLTPGVLFAPISHNVLAVTHLGVNLAILLLVGCLVEPHLGGRSVLASVLGIGYLSTYLANLTVGIHGYWVVAGASGGVFALLAYGAVGTVDLAIRPFSSGTDGWRSAIESVLVAALLVAVPMLLVHQSLLVATPHSGHVIGLLLGGATAGVDRFRSTGS